MVLITDSSGGVAPIFGRRTFEEGKESETKDLLPFVGLSTWALLSLLATWCSALPRMGGMQKLAHRQAARECLSALLCMVLEAVGGLAIPIDLQETWDIVWPRPSPHWKCELLSVGADGTVNFLDWVDRLKQRHPASPRQWWHEKHLRTLSGDSPSLTLLDLFVGVCSGKRFLPFFKQVLWALGQALQAEILKGARGQGEFEVELETFANVLQDGPALDRKLVSYVLAGQEMARQLNLRSFSCATDKASVGGLGAGVQGSLFVLGSSNICVVAPPQVPPPGEGPMCLNRPPTSPNPGPHERGR